MAISRDIRAVFGCFQNLNLLVLLHDLRAGEAVRQGWAAGELLCPVAHGLPSGQLVRELRMLGQWMDLARGCHLAARGIGADPAAVVRFVQAWDEGYIGREGLLQQLEEMWDERVVDAEFVQQILEATRSAV
jgi:hypothetical protein